MEASPARYAQAQLDDNDVEGASESQTQDHSSYAPGKRTLVFALVLGVVGILAVISVGGATWQQKDTPSDVTAVTGLAKADKDSAKSLSDKSDHEPDPGVCSADHMGQVKKAMAAVKAQLTKGVTKKDKKLWKKWFGEEPDKAPKGSTDEAVQKIMTNALSHMYNKFQEKKVELKMMGKKPESWHAKINDKWETSDQFDLSWPWSPRCCGQTKKKQYHCDGVCDNNYFFNWGATNDVPGVVHICPKAWGLDDATLGAGLFHNALHLAGGGDDSVSHGMEWSMWLATDSPLQARHSTMNYMLYVVENGMGEKVFKDLSEHWYALYKDGKGGFKKWQGDAKQWEKQQVLKAAKKQEEAAKKAPPKKR